MVVAVEVAPMMCSFAVVGEGLNAGFAADLQEP